MYTSNRKQLATSVHLRNLLLGAVGSAIVVILQKGGVDLFLPALFGWLLLSIFAITKTSDTKGFIIWNILLLVADSILDILAMGLHLPHWLHTSWILPWRFSTSGQGKAMIYWIFLWGVAVPNRTLAMLDRIPISASKTILFLAVIGLHVTFVEDVIYFSLLGYPPFITTPPLNYAYLPHLFGIWHWTAQRVWLISAIGSFFYVLAAVRALIETNALSRSKKDKNLSRTV